MRLKDVATVVDSVEDERIQMRFWVRGYPPPTSTVVVAVNRQAGANAVDVAKSVRALLPIINAELPPSIRITPIYDRSRSIVNSVADVEETLLIAFGLVVLVIFIFLGRATDTLIPAVALPLSLLLTFIVMRMLSYSLDNLSLMALTLAIGFLVDDAIVFLENTVRRMERGEKALEATLAGAKEISFTILSMTISLAAVFIPLVFMSGIVGRIFREFAVTIVVAIIASGVVSLTLTPLMCARLLKDRGPGSKKTWMERRVGGIEHKVLGWYGTSLTWFLRHRWVSALTWVACLAGTIWLFMSVPKSFLPTGDSSFLAGIMIGREGSSPQQMRALQTRADEVLRADPARPRDVHGDGDQPARLLEPGLPARVPEAPRGARADPGGRGARDGHARAGARHPRVHATAPGPRDRRRRDEPEPGPVRVLPLGRQRGAGLRGRGRAHGEALRLARLPDRLVGLLQPHAERRGRDPPRPGEDARRVRDADPASSSGAPTRRTTCT